MASLSSIDLTHKAIRPDDYYLQAAWSYLQSTMEIVFVMSFRLNLNMVSAYQGALWRISIKKECPIHRLMKRTLLGNIVSG